MLRPCLSWKQVSFTPVPQDESQATHVKMMSKSLGRIDWNKDADTIERLVRGLNSWPSAYTYFQEKKRENLGL